MSHGDLRGEMPLDLVPLKGGGYGVVKTSQAEDMDRTRTVGATVRSRWALKQAKEMLKQTNERSKQLKTCLHFSVVSKVSAVTQIYWSEGRDSQVFHS